jgi:uncharacterized protein
MRCTALKTGDGRWVARRVLMAHSFRERLFGLLRVKTLELDEGLMLSPGASIHTFGMRYPIDAVFLNGQMKILKVAAHVAPWRVRVAPTDTKHVLEVSAGRARALGLNPNTFLCVDPDTDSLLDRSDPPRHRPTTPLCAAPFRFSLRMPRNAAHPHLTQSCNADPQAMPARTETESTR